VGLFGMGLAAALSNAHWLALIQTKVGLELQGRVVAADNLISWSIQPLGFILAGPLSDRIFEPLMSGDGPVARSLGTLIGLGPGRGMGLMMILAGVVSVALTITAYRYRPLRLLEDILPDAIPEATIAADKDELQRQADRQLLAEVV
jgi:hypothetical protein